MDSAAELTSRGDSEALPATQAGIPVSLLSDFHETGVLDLAQDIGLLPTTTQPSELLPGSTGIGHVTEVHGEAPAVQGTLPVTREATASTGRLPPLHPSGGALAPLASSVPGSAHGTDSGADTPPSAAVAPQSAGIAHGATPAAPVTAASTSALQSGVSAATSSALSHPGRGPVGVDVLGAGPADSVPAAPSQTGTVTATATSGGAGGTNTQDDAGDGAVESGDPGDGRRKRRPVRTADRGKGLRHFSMKVCEKVESKGRTTYNEVADELVMEFTAPDQQGSSALGQDQQYDEKNIRRRVYDALNVLMAMDIISKEKKEIKWKGLPPSSASHQLLMAEAARVRSRVEKKAAHLQELKEQMAGIERLMRRNEAGSRSGVLPPGGGVALPFILVQTRPQATVEVEISEDMQLVHFDFGTTPFELHDDSYVLRAMGLCGGPLDDVFPSTPSLTSQKPQIQQPAPFALPQGTDNVPGNRIVSWQTQQLVGPPASIAVQRPQQEIPKDAARLQQCQQQDYTISQLPVQLRHGDTNTGPGLKFQDMMERQQVQKFEK